jgi:alpha-beta hydrolase superfamily lysophospholipase
MSVFEDFLRLWREHMPPPYHVLAHSTGAAIVVDHLLTHEDDDFGQVVLVAPLVRSAYWGLSKTFTPVADFFVDDVPRVFRANTSNEQFSEFLRQDPLQHRRTSLAWFDALVAWNGRIEEYPPSSRPVVIIQGDADSVVDWEYNLGFLERKFPNARVERIDYGRHQLLNEATALRGRVLKIVDEVLTNGSRVSN